VATLVAQELNTVCPGEPPRPWAVFTGNLPGKILEEHSLSERIEQFMPEDFRFPLTESFEFLLGLHPRPGCSGNTRGRQFGNWRPAAMSFWLAEAPR
jgi:hypothetical protein